MAERNRRREIGGIRFGTTAIVYPLGVSGGRLRMYN
jgi:hypothetical protein